MLNEATSVSARLVGACLLALGCQAFASPDSDRVSFEPRAAPPGVFGPGPQSSTEPAPTTSQRPPSPRPGSTDAGDDAGVGSARAPDAAPFEDAGPLQDGGVGASPDAGDAGD